jgi:hypothetical protein
VIWQKKIKFQTEIFISNFKNENFQFFHFKNENFQKFSWHISKISIYLLVVWTKFFKFQNQFFVQFFPFPSSGMTKFFKIEKQKISIQNSKTKFFISNFLWHKRFFSRPKVAKFIKRLPNY